MMRLVDVPSSVDSSSPLSPALRPWRTIAILGALLLVLAGTPEGARAQWDSLELQPISPAARTRAGVQLLSEDRPADALSYLRNAFAADSVLVVPPHGSAAYWLGEAYARLGDSAQAVKVWRRGVRAFRSAPRVDARLADAYLRSLSRPRLRNERLQAVEVYAGLLSQATGDTSEALRPLFRRRVFQVAPLLSDDVFDRVIDGTRSKEPETWSLRPDAGEALRVWWRGLDPFPGTDENERLEEHLTRLVHARSSFSCPSAVGGLDDRGTVYLRFGDPYKRRELSYKDGEFFREVFRFGVHMSPNAFPSSEIWLYPQIDESGFYLFAERETSGCYELSRANDLLPRALTRIRGKNKRGLNYAYSALMAMRAIYRELALYHINFGGRYTQIANYASYQEMQATQARMDRLSGQSLGGDLGERQVTVGAGMTARTVTENPLMGIQAPNFFVSQMVARAAREDARAAERREENMPRQHTSLREDTPPLPVAVRTARFLNRDGSTRTEVYWGIPAPAARLVPDEEDADPVPSIIRFSVVQQDPDRTVAQRESRRYRLSARVGEERQVITPVPVALQNTPSLYHLSMQWSQHPLRERANGAGASMGTTERFASARADSLSPLRASGPAPEMSDLQVLSLPDTTDATLQNLTEQAFYYPFRTIRAGTPLVLSFEVYHLTFGADDQTQYSLSYEVRGETRRGWTRLFRGQDTQTTATETTLRGEQRRTQERILLDLSKIESDEPQDVRVTVRVTDEITGESVSRSINFVLQPREDS